MTTPKLFQIYFLTKDRLATRGLSVNFASTLSIYKMNYLYFIHIVKHNIQFCKAYSLLRSLLLFNLFIEAGTIPIYGYNYFHSTFDSRLLIHVKLILWITSLQISIFIK